MNSDGNSQTEQNEQANIHDADATCNSNTAVVHTGINRQVSFEILKMAFIINVRF